MTLEEIMKQSNIDIENPDIFSALEEFNEHMKKKNSKERPLPEEQKNEDFSETVPEEPGEDELPEEPGEDELPEEPGEDELPEEPGEDGTSLNGKKYSNAISDEIKDEYRELTIDRIRVLQNVVNTENELKIVDASDYNTRNNSLIALDEQKKDLNEIETRIHALDEKYATDLANEYKAIMDEEYDTTALVHIRGVYDAEREALPSLAEIDWSNPVLNDEQKKSLNIIMNTHQRNELDKANALQITKNVAINVWSQTKEIGQTIGNTIATNTLAAERKFVKKIAAQAHNAEIARKKGLYIKNPFSKVAFLQAYKTLNFSKIRQTDRNIKGIEGKLKKVFDKAEKTLARQYKWKELLKRDKTEISKDMVDDFLMTHQKQMKTIKNLEIKKAEATIKKIDLGSKINDISKQQIDYLMEKGLDVNKENINLDKAKTSIFISPKESVIKNIQSPMAMHWMSSGISKQTIETALKNKELKNVTKVSAINSAIDMKIDSKDVAYMIKNNWDANKIQTVSVAKAARGKDFNFSEIKRTINNNIPLNQITTTDKDFLNKRIEKNTVAKEHNNRFLEVIKKSLPSQIYNMRKEDTKMEDLAEELNEMPETVPTFQFGIQSKYIDKETFDNLKNNPSIECLEKGGMITFVTHSSKTAREIDTIKTNNPGLNANMHTTMNKAGENVINNEAIEAKKGRDEQKKRAEETRKFLNNNRNNSFQPR